MVDWGAIAATVFAVVFCALLIWAGLWIVVGAMRDIDNVFDFFRRERKRNEERDNTK